ncbi:MAG: acyltransferase [Sphingobium sp.]|nr:acyltransferase [Sphingobium sp.]
MAQDINKPRIYSIQALRGIAAFMVVVAHAIEHGPTLSGNSVIITGRFGVEIFFIISGLVIMLSAGQGTFSPKEFIIRRLWRVVPLYWLTTFMLTAITIFKPSILKTSVFEMEYFIKSLFFIPSPLPGSLDWRPIFKLGWTLNYEIFFYALMAMTFWCKSYKIRAFVMVFVLSIFLVGSVFFDDKESILSYYFNLNILPFIIGVTLAFISPKKFIDIHRNAKIILALIAVVMTIMLYQMPYKSTKLIFGHIIMALSAGSIVVTFLSFEGKKYASFFKWCGDISYSLYLTHMFILGIAWAIIGRIDLLQDGFLNGAAIFAMIAASLLIADLVYRFVEKPLLRLIGSSANKAKSA